MESGTSPTVSVEIGQMSTSPGDHLRAVQPSQSAAIDSLEQQLVQSLYTLVQNGISSCGPCGLWFKLGVMSKYKLEGELDTTQDQGIPTTEFEQRFGTSRLQVRAWLLQEGKLVNEATNVLLRLILPDHQPKRNEYKVLLAAVCYWKLGGKGPITSTDAGIAEYLHISEGDLDRCLHKAQVIIEGEENQMKSRRVSIGPPPEPELEDYLAEVFIKKTQQGQLPTKDWLMEEGKRWFEEARPDRVSVDPDTGTKVYRGFKISSSWLDRFRVRKNLDFRPKRKPVLGRLNGAAKGLSSQTCNTRRLTATKMERLDAMAPQARRESILATNNAVQ